jgi:hypothetical protein
MKPDTTAARISGQKDYRLNGKAAPCQSKKINKALSARLKYFMWKKWRPAANRDNVH